MTTIPFNLLLCLVLGLGFTACARAQLQSGAWPWRSDLLGLVLSFSLLSAAPLAAYLYLLYPDWSWMYLVDPQRLPPGTALAVVVLTTLLVPVGYFAGWLLLRLAGDRALFAALGAAAMALPVLLVLGRGRITVQGRFEDFHDGLHRPLGQGRLLWALLCTAPPLYGAALLVARTLWSQGRWLRQQAAVTSSRGRARPGPSSRPGLPTVPHAEGGQSPRKADS